MIENKCGLKKIRQEKGYLIQWRFSEKIGIDQSRISLIERGATPRNSEIEKITGFFGLSAVDIWPESHNTTQENGSYEAA